MTGYTAGDLLPYPNDYEQPADTPNAIQANATAVQTALNKRMPFAYTMGELSAGSGWAHFAGSYGNARFNRTGKLIVGYGLLKRTAALTVTDNGTYPLGTLPAGYRPQFDLRLPTAWVASTSSRQFLTTQLIVGMDGSVQILSNVAGTMNVDDWVSFAGLVWMTP